MNIQKRSRIWLSGLKLAALAVMCGSLASADVLYWSDFTVATSSIPGGITLAGLTGVAATSDNDFVAKLTGGTWDAVIIAFQDLSLGSYNSSILGDLTAYVNGGGKFIGTDFASGDTSFFALFEAAPVD